MVAEVSLFQVADALMNMYNYTLFYYIDASRAVTVIVLKIMVLQFSRLLMHFINLQETEIFV